MRHGLRLGYERNHYDVSIACAERKLLPAIRARRLETTVVPSGLSCRSQIEQAGLGKSRHVAQVVQRAYEEAR